MHGWFIGRRRLDCSLSKPIPEYQSVQAHLVEHPAQVALIRKTFPIYCQLCLIRTLGIVKMFELPNLGIADIRIIEVFVRRFSKGLKVFRISKSSNRTSSNKADLTVNVLTV